MNGTCIPFIELPPDSEYSEDEGSRLLDTRSVMPRETQLQKLLYGLESDVDNLYALSVIIRDKLLSYDRHLMSS